MRSGPPGSGIVCMKWPAPDSRFCFSMRRMPSPPSYCNGGLLFPLFLSILLLASCRDLLNTTLSQATEYRGSSVSAGEFATLLLGHPASIASCRIHYAALSPSVFALENPRAAGTYDTLYRYTVGPHSHLQVFVSAKGKDYLLGGSIQDNLVPLLNGVRVGNTRAEVLRRVRGLHAQGEDLLAVNGDSTCTVHLRFADDTLKCVTLIGYLPEL